MCYCFQKIKELHIEKYPEIKGLRQWIDEKEICNVDMTFIPKAEI